MCLINFAYRVHPKYKLIVAANRDEFYERQTKEAHFWPEYLFMLGGKDLEQGGMWLGITKNGRFSALTNYREIDRSGKTYRTRGELVKNFLIENNSPYDYMLSIEENKDEYPGFNLLVGDMDGLYFYSNRDEGIKKVEQGIYSLCNGPLDCNWQKVERGKKYIEACLHIEDEKELEKKLFKSLLDEEKAPNELLPNTGFTVEMERFLSSIYIKGEDYGTRSSTVLLISHENNVTFTEKTYVPQSKIRTFSFVIK